MQYMAPEKQRQQDKSANKQVKKVFESRFESQEDPPLRYQKTNGSYDKM